MPVLAIGGGKASGDVLAQQMKLVASNVTAVILKDTGHWLLEERPQETTDALVKTSKDSSSTITFDSTGAG